VFIEEAFERLMLDYDRVFSCMGIPACLWRRTGEIYKGNREFAELAGVEGYMLRDVGFPTFTPSTSLRFSLLTGEALHLRTHGRGISCELLGGAHTFLASLQDLT
jgi:hypothetical protein